MSDEEIFEAVAESSEGFKHSATDYLSFVGLWSSKTEYAADPEGSLIGSNVPRKRASYHKTLADPHLGMTYAITFHYKFE